MSRSVGVLDQHRELVAADPRDQVRLARGSLQALADRAQNVIAAGVAVQRVGALEVVEVDQQQRRLARDSRIAVDNTSVGTRLQRAQVARRRSAGRVGGALLAAISSALSRLRLSANTATATAHMIGTNAATRESRCSDWTSS